MFDISKNWKNITYNNSITLH